MEKKNEIISEEKSKILFHLLQMWCVCRKALAKTGLQHVGPQPTLAASGQMEQQREPSSTIDWTVSLLSPPRVGTSQLWFGSILEADLCVSQDNAQFGEHIWFETGGSGDFCYVGEQYCFAKSLVSFSAPLWSYVYTHLICQSCGFTRLFMK